MAKTYALTVGTVLLLVGILGWIFRDPFGQIPVYHLVVNILAGLWGLAVGFSKSSM
ncbi:MAG: hypothetical protein M1275_01985 [Patescibacteria group bacterium]|nr:hypothetical protein [Patescibacteria group bacterium]